MKKLLHVLIFLLASVGCFGQIYEDQVRRRTSPSAPVFARLSSNETVSGVWQFSASVGLGGAPGNTLSIQDSTDNSATAPGSYDGGFSVANTSNINDSYAQIELAVGTAENTDFSYIRGLLRANNQTDIRFGEADNSGSNSGTDHVVIEGGTGRLGIGIDSLDGTLHAHSGDAGLVGAHSTANEGVFENSADAGISILSPDANSRYIAFGSPTDNREGLITYHANDDMSVQVNATEALRIDGPTRHVGVGTSSPATNLHLSEDTTETKPAIEIEQLDAGGVGDAGMQWSISGDSYAMGIDNSDSDIFKLSYGTAAGTAELGTNDLLLVRGAPAAFEPTFRFESAATDAQVAYFNTPSGSTTTNTLWAHAGTSYATLQTKSSEAFFWLLDQDFGNDITGPQLRVGRNTNATNTSAGSVRFTTKSGTQYYLWVDDTGDLRIHTSAPSGTGDTNGTVVGTQN